MNSTTPLLVAPFLWDPNERINRRRPQTASSEVDLLAAASVSRGSGKRRKVAHVLIDRQRVASVTATPRVQVSRAAERALKCVVSDPTGSSNSGLLRARERYKL